MNADEILRLAVECQLLTTENRNGIYAGALIRFAALVRAAALEEAAGVCETNADRWPGTSKVYAAMECAAAIRALEDKT